MAIAQVGTVGVGRAAANPTTGSIDSSGANLIVGGTSEHGSGAAGTYTDNKSNSPTGLTVQDSGAGGIRLRLWYKESAAVGAGHTGTDTGGDSASVCLAAFSGVLGASAFDVENGVLNGSFASLQTGSITPSVNGCVLVSIIGFDVDPGTISIDSGFSTPVVQLQSGAERGIAFAFLVQGTAAAINPTWATTNLVGGGVAIAALKPSTTVPAAIIFKHA